MFGLCWAAGKQRGQDEAECLRGRHNWQTTFRAGERGMSELDEDNVVTKGGDSIPNIKTISRHTVCLIILMTLRTVRTALLLYASLAMPLCSLTPPCLWI